MTPTDPQKREALAWAALRDRPGEFPCPDTEPLKVLAACLRLADSELSALRAEKEALKRKNENQAVAIRTVNCALGNPDPTEVMGRLEKMIAAEAKVAQQSELIIELGAKLNATKQREEGLEGRLARIAEALKAESQKLMDIIYDYEPRFDIAVQIENASERMRKASLRETEGGASK